MRKSLRKIDDFIARKILARKIRPIIYLLWISVAIFIRRDLIGVWPITKFLILFFFGLMFLMLGIRGVRDRKMSSWGVKDTKKDALFWGYIAILISIIILFYPW